MSIGNEYVYRVNRSASSYRVEYRDGTGLREGVFTIPTRRYFDDLESAIEHAESKAAEDDNARAEVPDHLCPA